MNTRVDSSAACVLASAQLTLSTIYCFRWCSSANSLTLTLPVLPLFPTNHSSGGKCSNRPTLKRVGRAAFEILLQCLQLAVGSLPFGGYQIVVLSYAYEQRADCACFYDHEGEWASIGSRNLLPSVRATTGNEAPSAEELTFPRSLILADSATVVEFKQQQVDLFREDWECLTI